MGERNIGILKDRQFDNSFEAVWDALQDHKIIRLDRGAEIGVRHGIFSEYILDHYKLMRMFLVDPYLPYQDIHEYFSEEMQLKIQLEAKQLLSAHPVTWMPMVSVEAAEWFSNQFFDFVFIDAEHTYGAVKNDIAVWEPKVRKGGLLCGHDFMMNGVNQAVTEFAKEHKHQVYSYAPPADVWCIFI